MEQLQAVADLLRSEPAVRSKQRVYQLIREGLLPSVRIGHRIFVDAARWREFRRSGSKALAGGWRREPVEAV
jgi:hypothetical protein